MRDIETTFAAFGNSVLPIGVTGENFATKIYIDCTSVFEDYPYGHAAMTINPPSGTPYPGDIVTQDGVVFWQVRSRDLMAPGRGTATLSIVDSFGTVLITATATTVINGTIPSGTEPDQIADWLQAASVALEETNQALYDIQETLGQAESQLSEMEAATEAAQGVAVGSVRFDQAQLLTAAQKQRARENIGAAMDGGGGGGTADLSGVIAVGYGDLVFPVKQGTYTVYNNKMYVSKQDIDVDESFTPAHWEETTAGNELYRKAPAIMDEVTRYYHENVAALRVNGSAYAWGNVKYANQKNILELSAVSRTSVGVNIESHGNIVVMNGTATAANDLEQWTIEGLELPAGTYTYAIKVYAGDSVLSGTKNFQLDFWYEGATARSQIVKLAVGSSDVSGNKTTTEKTVKLVVWLGLKSGNVYDDYRVFLSLFPAGTTVTDTEQTVSASGTMNLTFDSAMPKVDTLMHSSTVETVVDTKTYVDSHVPDINFVYVKPEDYGAYGDGAHDDSEALQACINAAQADVTHSLAVRAYGKYRISTGLVIHGRELNIFINHIDYRGNDAAVTISAAYSRFVFNDIRANTSGQTNAVGIRLAGWSEGAGTFNGFTDCDLTCHYLFTNSHTVQFVNNYPQYANVFYYDAFHFNMQRSEYGDLIHIENAMATELDFYGKAAICPNGYALYCPGIYEVVFRMHEYCFEGSTKNGVYGKAHLINCRFTEMMNQKTSEAMDKGNVFVFEDCVPGGTVEMSDVVDLTAIDVSQAYSFQDALDAVKDYYDENPSANNWGIWANLFGLQNGKPYCRIMKCNRSANAQLTTGSMKILAMSEIYVYYQSIARKPMMDIYAQVSGDMTIALTSENDYTYETPTIFDIDASAVEIHLDASYCCLAINHFDVIQYSGKTAKVYDKNDNLIFDGTSLGAGVYHFTCSFEQLASLSVTTTGGTVKSCPTAFLPGLYTGTNEKWTVTKETLIEPPAAT